MTRTEVVELIGDGVPECVAEMVYDQAGICKSLDRQLRRLAADIEETAARVDQMVAKGRSLNELGELQSRGVEFDRLVALRAYALTTLERMNATVWQLRKTYPG